MTKPRFKIDVNYPTLYFPVALYVREVEIGFLGGRHERWVLIESFKTVDEARAHYEKVKDLPQYLP